MMGGHMKTQDIISAFVSGKMSSDEFEQHLYGNKALEEELSNNELDIKPHVGRHELYFFLIQKNYKSCYDLWDVQDALLIYLRQKNVEIEATDLYEKQADLLYKIQPSWLDVPGDFFAVLLGKHNNKKGKDLEVALKNEIKEKFKYMNKPPRWLQSPQWPIIDDCPLFFIGQIDISKIRHDTAFAYLFHDESSKTYRVVEQYA
jgi:hypothetical protein